MTTPSPLPPNITLRNTLLPGDVEAIIQFHIVLYSREFGLDETFRAHVAEPLERFAKSPGQRERVWIAESDGRMVGCIAIVNSSPREARLRWFLVGPEVRGRGLGRKLLNEAIAFSVACRYESIILGTLSVLTTATRLYRGAGFELIESAPRRMWGADLVEETYRLALK